MAVKGDFFAQKREWSRLKDQILDHYLVPYLAKITNTGRPTRIVDCFAGKGKFGDGQPGSPLIIATRIAETLARTPRADVQGVFIEQKYATDLKKNLAGQPNCEVIATDYETHIQAFLSGSVNRDQNHFFYVDPYGIKNLDFRHFARLKETGFRSIEILINLNTTGFLREGARLLALDLDFPDWAIDHDYETDGRNTTARMNDVAGGDYWQTTLNRFQKGQLDFRQTEEEFIAGYLERLGTSFKYVVSIPIKERSHRMPKYRMVFATDHHDGLFLMTDEMNAAWQTFLARERGGQLFFFDDAELDTLAGRGIETKIQSALISPMDLKDLLVALIRKHGIAHTTGDYRKAIKAGTGTTFTVMRDPPITPTGRASTSMDHNKVRITVENVPRAQLELL